MHTVFVQAQTLGMRRAFFCENFRNNLHDFGFESFFVLRWKRFERAPKRGVYFLEEAIEFVTAFTLKASGAGAWDW